MQNNFIKNDTRRYLLIFNNNFQQKLLNSVMKNFFSRLKTEMLIGETFSSIEDFQQKLEEYICYFNNERVSLKLKGMSPVQFRTHSM